MDGLTVGLLNDSFPPTIDGVANAILNYARYIQQNHGTAVVATPWYPNVADDYPFEVLRYPSAYISKKLGYRAGYPFDPRVISRLEKRDLNLIHTHCPFISGILARYLRFQMGIPVVFTYHTKFDIDIEKRVASAPVRLASVKFILSNINACDEVWVVSRGAGENLRGLGFSGDFVIMENGTDFPRGRASQDAIQEVRALYDLAPDVPVFLFVGRMMWYKNIKLTIDALRLLAQDGIPFHMLFVGEGVDRPDIKAYVDEQGLSDRCTFTGAIRDRSRLKAYFSAADLFLFPSTYDTNGLVVKEAAACNCPSLLIKGSCAAEGVVHGETGLLTDETPEGMARTIADVCRNRERLSAIGKDAGERVYLSWADAVAKAYDRYAVVLENHARKLDQPSRIELPLESLQRVRGDIALKTRRFFYMYMRQGKKMRASIRRSAIGRKLRRRMKIVKRVVSPAYFRSDPSKDNDTPT